MIKIVIFLKKMFEGNSMASSNFNMSFDPQLKQQFAEIVEGYGLTVPQAFKLLANQVIRTKVLPISFDWQAENSVKNYELTERIKKELAQNEIDKANGKVTRFSSAEELMTAIKGMGNE